MLALGSGRTIYLAAGSTDLRKSFDTLGALVRQQLRLDPLEGQLFVFCNKRCNRIKILFWDRTGFWVCAKRLEEGTFDWPTREANAAVVLEYEQLAVLLGGLEWRGMKARGWYQRLA